MHVSQLRGLANAGYQAGVRHRRHVPNRIAHAAAHWPESSVSYAEDYHQRDDNEASTSSSSGRPPSDLQLAELRRRQRMHQGRQDYYRPGYFVTHRQVLMHRKAKALLLQGRPDVALAIIKRALRSYPHDTHFISLAASLESKLGNSQRAQQLLDEALEQEPENAALLVTAATVHARKQEFEPARQLFSRAHSADPFSAAALQAWAMMEASSGDVKAAQQLFAQALELDSSLPHTRNAWARTEAAVGNMQQARDMFRAAVEAHPGHAPSLHSWAEFEVRHGRLDEAQELLERALQAVPSHLPSWISLGRVHWMAGNRKRARLTWAEGHGRAGPSAQLLCQWARHEVRAGGKQARMNARELLAAALTADPHHEPSLRAAATLEDMAWGDSRAQSLYSASHEDADVVASAWAAAQGMRRRSGSNLLQTTGPQISRGSGSERDAHLRDSSGNTPASDASSQEHAAPRWRGLLAHGRVQQLLRQGNRKGAEQLLSELEAEDGGDPLLCYMRGLMAVQEGRLDDATAWFTKGLVRRDGLGRAADGVLLNYEGLAETQAFRGDAEAARATFASGLKACCVPTLRYLRQYAQLEKRLGSFDSASTLYRRAAQLNPVDPKTWLQWGVMERRRRRYDAAEECFRRGVAAAPRHPHLWYAYTTMLWRLGRLDEARKLFHKATHMCPGNPPLWMEWALLESSTGNVVKARSLFERGTQVRAPVQHPPLYEAWARMEAEAGNAARAAVLMEQAAAIGAQQQMPAHSAAPPRTVDGPLQRPREPVAAMAATPDVSKGFS